MKVSIAHDYLLQYGGAERVVATWARELPDSPIYSLAYDSTKTFDIFKSRSIRTSLKKAYLHNRIEYLLPLLPLASGRVKVDGDVALVSTSGWAHQFDFQVPTVAYVHSPARWLYAEVDYAKKLGMIGRLGLAMSAPYLRRADAPAMRRMDAVLSNSRVSQQRTRDAYGIQSEIVHPPVEHLDAHPSAPQRRLPASFSLVVSRNRGYKNARLAIESSTAAGLPCVVVGSGTSAFDEESSGVYGLDRVTDGELRWLYQRASVLIGSAHEDFGLTVLEANLEGTPAAAIPVGGYLETVSHGTSGCIASDESIRSLAEAVRNAVDLQSADCKEWASGFSVQAHMRQLREVLGNV